MDVSANDLSKNIVNNCNKLAAISLFVRLLEAHLERVILSQGVRTVRCHWLIFVRLDDFRIFWKPIRIWALSYTSVRASKQTGSGLRFIRRNVSRIVTEPRYAVTTTVLVPHTHASKISIGIAIQKVSARHTFLGLGLR